MLHQRMGFEVLEAMYNRISVPVIVLSALSDLPARLNRFESSAVDSVLKTVIWKRWLSAGGLISKSASLRPKGAHHT